MMRGAGYNPDNRFKAERHVADLSNEVDAWEIEPEGDPKTQFLTDHSKSVLTHNDSPDIPFNTSINPYRGCEHGCVYCYARPTHEYLGYSSGIEFESKILVKEKAPELLREALSKKSYRPEVINVSGVTDCYQPVERRLQLTRRCLEVMREFSNPFTIITKNFTVTRDIDIIAPMAAQNQAAVFVTVTTLDRELASTLEPRTSSPRMRLETIRQLAMEGIPVGVMIAPVIPGLTDLEIPKILQAAAEAGARWSAFVPLRLPLSVAPIFENWLETHYPDRKKKVVHHIQSIRGGKMNDPSFATRMYGTGVIADHIRGLYHLWEKKLNLNSEELKLDTGKFCRPGDQLRLF